MRSIVVLSLLASCAGCRSVNVGAGIPIPGPISPSVGVSIDRSGVSGHGGVGTTVGKVPVHVGGSTERVKLPSDEPKKKK